MKKKPTRKRRAGAKASVGYRIVRAWFDTVVNPLIRALQTEQVHLDKRDWTWRFQPPSLEMFRPVAGHVSAAARDNLEQFLAFHKEASDKAKEHDKQLAELLQACLHLHTAVFQSDRLRRLYTTLTSPDALKELAAKEPNLRLLLEQGQPPEAIRNRFFGGYPESEHLHVLAQYIVNHSPDLPSYFSTAPFWNEHKESFWRVLDEPDGKPVYDRTVMAGEKLLKTVSSLLARLKEIRLRLSLEHDMPYVEVQPQVQAQPGWQ